MIMFYFQSTRTLELTLNMEAHVIHLKQDALHLFNLAVAGCACGTLVDLFELAYGYPQSEEQKKRVKEFEKLKRQFSDHDEKITILDPKQDEQEQAKILSHPFQQHPPAIASTSKEDLGKSGEPSKKSTKRIIPEFVGENIHRKQITKKSCTMHMIYPDLMKLRDATSLYPMTSIKLCWTGVTLEMFHSEYVSQASSKCTGNTKVSRYSCCLYIPKSTNWLCNYSTSNAGQMGTHICHCHLGISIECRAYSVRSFCTCNMTKPLKSVHKNNAHVFYKQLPDLSGMQAEDVSGKLTE